MTAPRVTRAEARYVPCPYCGARATEPCTGANRQPRLSNHAQRVRYATRVLAPPRDRGDAAQRFLTRRTF